MPEVLLGFGGNLGDPLASIEAALERLEETGVGPTRRSGFYRTRPWGGVPQPDYVNLCAAMSTALAPRDLLALTQRIERDLGRVSGERWGPRPIDIDILIYEGVEMSTTELTLPHPRMLERAFVLVPLAEIAGDLLVAGRPIAAWAGEADTAGIELI